MLSVFALVILYILASNGHELNPPYWSLNVSRNKEPSPARYSLSAVSVDSDVIFFGGADAMGNYHSDIWNYDTEKNVWTRLRESDKNPRGGHTAVTMCDSKKLVMLVYGNQFDSNDSSIIKYTVSNREYSEIKPRGVAPKNRYNHEAGSFDQTMIIFGGQDAKTEAPLDDTWLFSLVTHTWSQFIPRASPPARFMSTGSWNSHYNLFFVFGGASTASRGLLAFNDLWTFSLSERTWTLQTPTGAVPSPRCGAVSVIKDDGTFVIFGGQTPTGNSLTDTYTYDLSSNLWSPVHATTRNNRILPAAGFVRFPSRMVVYGDAMNVYNSVDVLTLDHAHPPEKPDKDIC